MIPVTLDSLNEIIQRTRVLILDKSSIGVAYVDSLTRLSPQRITSKEGHKQLPLELWVRILAFAQAAPQQHFRGRDRRGTCELVIPHSLGGNANGVATLSCQPLRGSQFGLLKNCDLARLYKHYLKRPHSQLSEAKNPFRGPQTLQTTLVEIPVGFLASRIPTLFSHAEVQDVIWCAEAGDCGLCSGGRRLRIRGNEGRRLCRYLEVSVLRQDDMRGLCPLCVGENHFWDSLEMQETVPGNEQGRLSPDEYDAWERECLIKLGFADSS